MRLLGFGDSITNGIGDPNGGYFPTVVRGLRQDGPVTAINYSKGGRTTTQARLLAEEAALRFLPDLTIIAFGVNDSKPAKRNRPLVYPEVFFDNIKWIGREIRVRCCSEILLVTPPFGGYAQLVRNACMQERFLLADVAKHWEPGMDDGEHPNKDGHTLIAELVLAALVGSEVTS